jgi:hypothetical protein
MARMKIMRQREISTAWSTTLTATVGRWPIGYGRPLFAGKLHHSVQRILAAQVGDGVKWQDIPGADR